MRRYIKFDTEQFLKDSRHWEEQIESLKHELASITEIGGMVEGIPSGGGISRPTERIALDRNAIVQRIDKINEYKECFKFAWQCVGESDKLLLAGFYFTPGYIYHFVKRWCEENASNREYCYKAKREAENRFGAACERWMELHNVDER